MQGVSVKSTNDTLEHKTKTETEENTCIEEQIDEAHHTEFWTKNQVKESPNTKRESLRYPEDHTIEELTEYTPPPSTTSEKNVCKPHEMIDSTKGTSEVVATAVLPKARKSSTHRRASVPGKQNFGASPKRDLITSRRATFSGRDSTMSISEHQSQLFTSDNNMRKSKGKARNQSLRQRSVGIVQPDCRNQAGSFATNDSAPKPIRMVRDSLSITQPANRIPYQEYSDIRGVSFEQTKDAPSGKPARRPKQVAFRESEQVWILGGGSINEHSLTQMAKDRAGYCLNPMHAKHQTHLPQPSLAPLIAMVSPRKQGKISTSQRTVGDALIANLTSAWYWSGYYAGYQQRIAEE